MPPLSFDAVKDAALRFDISLPPFRLFLRLAFAFFLH